MRGTTTVDNTTPRCDDGNGEVLLDEEVVEPASLEDVKEGTNTAHQTRCKCIEQDLPVGEGIKGKIVGAIQRNDGIEDGKQPLVAELTNQGDYHQVVEMQLGCGSALNF